VEAAVTKLMFLLGQGLATNELVEGFGTSICGEVTA